MRRAGYLKVHGFPYSKRLYTAAASLPGQIAPPVKKERNRLLIEEADKVSLEFRRSLEGHRMRVLFEEKTEVDGRQLWKGRASNYTPVYFDSDEDLSNVFADMIAGPPLSDGVLGRKEDQ